MKKVEKKSNLLSSLLLRNLSRQMTSVSTPVLFSTISLCSASVSCRDDDQHLKRVSCSYPDAQAHGVERLDMKCFEGTLSNIAGRLPSVIGNVKFVVSADRALPAATLISRSEVFCLSAVRDFYGICITCTAAIPTFFLCRYASITRPSGGGLC